MAGQKSLLCTTMLTGVVGGVFLSVFAANAADLGSVPGNVPPNFAAPAVDGLNGKAEAFAGSLANRALYGVKGVASVPLAGQWGFQLDAIGGSLDQRAFGSIGGHLFWRDPKQALFGLYASHTQWNQVGGVHVSHVAAEAEYYWQRWTLQGIAGVEFGNMASNALVTYDVQTRFFDQINLKYYVTDDWNAYIGHRYLGGRNAFALGTEYALPVGRGTMASAFVEGRIGESDFHGLWGGLRFYFGQKDKTLIDRHRQDDPNVWGTDSLFSIVNSSGPGSCSQCFSLDSVNPE